MRIMTYGDLQRECVRESFKNRLCSDDIYSKAAADISIGKALQNIPGTAPSLNAAHDDGASKSCSAESFAKTSCERSIKPCVWSHEH
ncbi:hypothetical protein AVEN_84269-1 [Araneus ventricosus]|uniref:Uncharacterized protein n=1 Tax=Araneus ventricosus TaxID=182803 RepID=A0A4Y2ULI3_ARAVE|nr:hypothetical protein AVEN_84269-1 [Araneus ventricosus]